MNVALQIERLTAGIIESDENVIFNSTIISTSNISYDNITGIITLLEPGKYEFHWLVAMQSSPSRIGGCLALVSSQNDVIIGNSPIKTEEVVGFAIIDVSTTPVTVELRNHSNSAGSTIGILNASTESITLQNGSAVNFPTLQSSAGHICLFKFADNGIA